MNNGISVHILASLSWECGNVMKEQDHNYQMEDKNTPFPMPYFRAQWLGQFFSPGIFKGLIFSKQLLDTHIHTLRTWGFTTFHRQTAENLCHSSTHTWPDPTGRLTLQQCDSPHRALQTTLYIVPAQMLNHFHLCLPHSPSPAWWWSQTMHRFLFFLTAGEENYLKTSCKPCLHTLFISAQDILTFQERYECYWRLSN